MHTQPKKQKRSVMADKIDNFRIILVCNIFLHVSKSSMDGAENWKNRSGF